MSADLSNIRRLQEKSPVWDWVGDMYLAGNDCGVAMRLADAQQYEPQSRKLWQSLCRSAQLVIDIGAHTGRYSLDAWRSGAKEVLSVEPYPLNYARLIMNLRHSDFPTDNCAMCAAHDENKIVEIKSGNDSYYCSAGAKISHSKGWRRFKVEARRLDDLLNTSSHDAVKAIKIDAEGHVARILHGMPVILSHKPDLILECIEPGLTEILAPLGYTFYTINEKTGLEPVEDLVPDHPFTFDSPNRYATVKDM